jgi:hypothetical protein
MVGEGDTGSEASIIMPIIEAFTCVLYNGYISLFPYYKKHMGVML